MANFDFPAGYLAPMVRENGDIATGPTEPTPCCTAGEIATQGEDPALDTLKTGNDA
jgi:hypothetical protein